MSVLRMTEAELARDLPVVLKKLDEGDEVIVDRGDMPAVTLRSARPRGRMISEALAMLDPNSDARMTPDFARDIQAAVDAHQLPWEPPEWE